MSLYNSCLKKINKCCAYFEQSVLGALLLDNSIWDKISTLLFIKSFFYKSHKIIFSIILKLINLNKSFDIINVYEEIKGLNSIKYNIYSTYLNNLIQNTPNPSNVYNYAVTIHNMYILRKLIYFAKNLLTNIYFSEIIDINNLFSKIDLQIFNISKNYFKNKKDLCLIKSLFIKAYKNIKFLRRNPTNISGISTGFKDLDSILSGIHSGELIVIAGRPSMGKTTFALNIAKHIACVLKLPIIIFSMEMSTDQLILRILSSMSNLDQHLLRTGNLFEKDLNNIKKIIKKNYLIKMFIIESINLSVSEVYSKSQRIINEFGDLGLIIIDYLQLMNSSVYNYNRVIEISEISRSLKCLAKEFNVPVIAISQLNRGLELRNDKRPIMSDLRESGAIEQDADVILFIYRDEIYNKSTPDKGLAEIIVAKQRNGPIGVVILKFLESILKFKNFS